MFTPSWLSKPRRIRRSRPDARPRLRLEPLESRTAPAFVASLAAAQPPQTTFREMLGELNGLLIFRATDATHGLELWRSDGTAAGTYMIKDIRPGPLNSDPFRFTVMNGIGYFRANDGVLGEELWRTDGTDAGTWMVKDIRPGPDNSTPGFLASLPATWVGGQGFAVIGDVIYFSADDGALGRELWRSDGTATGTYLVKDINPGPSSASFSPGSVINSVLWFGADDGTHGRELWRTDGTSDGTWLVKDIQPGSQGSSPHGFGYSAVNGFVLFHLNPPDPSPEEPLWRTDGTAANTIALTNFSGPPYTGWELGIVRNTPSGDLAFFTVQVTSNYKQLWKTDGTPGGTVEVAPGSGWNFGEVQSHAGGDTFVYVTGDVGGLPGLWRSDGTVAGTFPVSNQIGSGKVFGDRAFTATYDNTLGNGTLWTSDGTVAGTRALQIIPGTGVFYNLNACRVGNTVFFYVRSAGGSVNDLWRIDETPAPPPRVLSTRVNDGAAQRSRVTSLTVTFTSPVAFVGNPAAAFTLTRDGGGPITFTAESIITGGKTVVTLSNFTGASTQFGSLADGRYTLRVLASQIHIEGVPLDGDGNGKPGDDYVFGNAQGLFRMYGDINGDRQVDGADFGAFSYTYASLANQQNYLWFLDVNGDGQIDGFDLSQFNGRYNTVLP